MKVLNKRTDKIPHDAVYVGRPSKWGNPFSMTKTGLSRERVIEKYKDYLLNSPSSPINDTGAIFELRGKDLVCWCSPKPCHADTLLELANKGEIDV